LNFINLVKKMSPRCAVQQRTVAKTQQSERSRGAAILPSFANTIGTFAVRFITANLNGIRSAANKGFFDWLPQ